MTGTMNAQETNFRIMALKINELLDGNRCIGGGGGGGSGGHRPQNPVYPINHRPPFGG